ncbi:hypothetical protein [Bacillus piscicola]|uniref:hypothetical protein n=1 Tax=Bacillus piscicola TaxID=1632684 RepID=UPI001F09DBC3|nr:hypothetical protein [Bacillus piscicola]
MAYYVKKKKVRSPIVQQPVTVIPLDQEEEAETLDAGKGERKDKNQTQQTETPIMEKSLKSNRHPHVPTNNMKRPPTFDESHVRKTIYFTIENQERLEKEKYSTRRSITRLVNDALDRYFADS